MQAPNVTILINESEKSLIKKVFSRFGTKSLFQREYGVPPITIKRVLDKGSARRSTINKILSFCDRMEKELGI